MTSEYRESKPKPDKKEKTRLLNFFLSKNKTLGVKYPVTKNNPEVIRYLTESMKYTEKNAVMIRASNNMIT